MRLATNWKRHIIAEVLSDFEFVVSWAPGLIGHKLRVFYLKRRLKQVGDRPQIGVGVQFIGPRNIVIGDDFSCWSNCTIAACDDGILEIGNSVKLNRQVYLNACVGGRIVLGNDVLVGPNVVLRASDHIIENSDKLISQQGSAGGEIIIEDDVWLASNVVVVSGVRVGKGSVAAAGAVVTRDVQPYTVVGGVPAKFLKNRGD